MCGGHGVWMGVRCPCPPVRNNIVTPRHLLTQSPRQMERTDCQRDKAIYKGACPQLKSIISANRATPQKLITVSPLLINFAYQKMDNRSWFGCRSRKRRQCGYYCCYRRYCFSDMCWNSWTLCWKNCDVIAWARRLREHRKKNNMSSQIFPRYKIAPLIRAVKDQFSSSL